MHRKLYLLLAVLVLAAMVLAACAPAATEAPTTAPTSPPEEMATEPPAVGAGSVGVVLPTREEPRWIQDETRFKDAFDAAGYDVEILFSQGDSGIERSNVEDLITKGVQVIILTPQDGSAAAAAAQEARDAGVKVIAYDRLILDTDAVDYYVTFDSIAVGEAQGQYLVDKASGTGNPLYLYAGAASDNNAFLFFEGAWNVLQPKIADGTFVIKNSSQAEALQDKAELTRDEMANIIGQVTTEWDFDTAKSLAEANLVATTADDKGDVFILAPNDGTARAIADAFAADADVSSYVVTGQDAEIASVQYIIDGKQSMTVLKDVRTLVADAIAAAVAYLEGGTPPETTTYNNGVIDVPAKPSEVITVDKDNVQSAIIDSGYWPASDFTGLGEAPAETPTEEVMLEPATACLVTDLAGVDDRSFNASAWKGVNEAVDAGYANPDPILLESSSEADYQPNMDACLGQGATHIVSVGFQLATATQTNAEANPDVKFTIVDQGYDPDIPNVRELVYQTDEAAFAAGYLAAGMTQTGIVGTYGGLNIPTVSIFMDGFTRGVQYYNEQKGTDVQVIGWDVDLQDGQFTDMGIARATCESILDEGADIMLPVGGAINNPCGDAIIDRGIDGALIGVDADAYFAMPEKYQDLWMTTIEKGIAIQVERSLADDAEGKWTPGGALGTVANGAVGLSPYHSWEDTVPDELKAEVQALLDAIAAGEINAAFTQVQ